MRNIYFSHSQKLNYLQFRELNYKVEVNDIKEIYNAIIIGGGSKWLGVAAYLAKCGLSV